MKKQDSLELQVFFKNEKIPFIEQDEHYDVLLLEESESISSEEFVEKAEPIIKQILSKSGVTNY
ncbi:MAG: hypothetical protein ACK4GF_16845 [Acinetobacter johnsonii]|nr:hypothetical protein [Acinetobacter johnsonii]